MKVSSMSDDLRNEYGELVDYYDEISNGYDELHFEEQKKKFALLAEYMNISEGAKVLDVGCGTFFSYDLFKVKLGWDLYGIEPSSKMVSLFVKSHPQEKNKIRVGFAEELVEEYGLNKFDALICVSVIHHFKDIFVVFEQMKSVCKPTAVIGITLLQGVNEFRGISLAIESSFLVEEKIESSKDVIFICRIK